MGRLFYAKVTGLDGLKRNNENLQREIRLGLTEATTAGAEILQQDAIRRAPRLSGDLARSIALYRVPQTGSPDLAITQVGPTEFYGRFVEKGTKRSRRRAFLLPAFEANKHRIIKTMHLIVLKAKQRVA